MFLSASVTHRLITTTACYGYRIDVIDLGNREICDQNSKARYVSSKRVCRCRREHSVNGNKLRVALIYVDVICVCLYNSLDRTKDRKFGGEVCVKYLESLYLSYLMRQALTIDNSRDTFISRDTFQRYLSCR